MAANKKGLIPDEAKIGIAFLLAIIIFVSGLFYLKDWRIAGDTYVITAEFDSATGIKRSDPLLLGGIRIGKVEEVKLENQIPSVIIRIDEPYYFPIDTRLEVISRSIMGEKSLVVHKGTSSVLVKDGGKFIGFSSPDLSTMMTEVNAVSVNVTRLLRNANTFLDPEFKGSISGSLSNVQEITQLLKTTLNRQSRQLHQVMANMDSVLNNIQDISASEKEKISTTMSNLERMSVALNTMMDKLQTTTTSLDNILARIERGEGTVGKLLRDDKLYDDMDRLFVNLDGLVADLKENPKKYLGISIF
ncbi:MAG: MlaD family protein [Gemmatimonadota bacterium]|nr:MlaD family protein [Gemmatimonadota bacterium]